MKPALALALPGLFASLALAQQPGGSADRFELLTISGSTQVEERFEFEVTEETEEATREKLEKLRNAALGRTKKGPLLLAVDLKYAFFEAGVKNKAGEDEKRNVVILLDRSCDFFGTRDHILSWQNREEHEGFLDPFKGVLTNADEFHTEIGTFEIEPEADLGEFWFQGSQTICGVEFADLETFSLAPCRRNPRTRPLEQEKKPFDVVDPRAVRQVHLRLNAGVNGSLTNSINKPRGPDDPGLYNRYERAVGKFDQTDFLLEPVELVIDYFYISLNPRLFGKDPARAQVVVPQRKEISFPGIEGATFTGDPQATYNGTVIDGDSVEVGRLYVNREVERTNERRDFVEFEFLTDYTLGQSKSRRAEFSKGDVIVFRQFQENPVED